MKAAQWLTAVIEREDDGFVVLRPELDIVSEGTSVEHARTNLVEALTLFFETSSPSEVARRARYEVFVHWFRETAQSPIGSGSFGDREEQLMRR